jgi:hypothetical protein
MAVRYLLQQLEDAYPGGTIELRVPPFGAVQILGGLNHRRGTPPNVVEINSQLFLELALGMASFAQSLGTTKLLLSGTRAQEIENLFPLSSDLY